MVAAALAVPKLLSLRRHAEKLRLPALRLPVEGIEPELPKLPPSVTVSLQVPRSTAAEFAAGRPPPAEPSIPATSW
jgi:hypothetical protein